MLRLGLVSDMWRQESAKEFRVQIRAYTRVYATRDMPEVDSGTLVRRGAGLRVGADLDRCVSGEWLFWRTRDVATTRVSADSYALDRCNKDMQCQMQVSCYNGAPRLGILLRDALQRRSSHTCHSYLTHLREFFGTLRDTSFSPNDVSVSQLT